MATENRVLIRAIQETLHGPTVDDLTDAYTAEEILTNLPDGWAKVDGEWVETQRWWWHAAHDLHDDLHHQRHRAMDACVPLFGRKVD